MESNLSTVNEENIDTWLKAFKFNLYFTLLQKRFEVAKFGFFKNHTSELGMVAHSCSPSYRKLMENCPGV